MPDALHVSDDCLIVPARGLLTGKSRLAEVLERDERIRLNRRMLRKVLAAAADLHPPFRAMAVVSPDASLVSEAARHRADLVEETVAAGMNAAIELGADYARTRGCTRLVVLPADLPLVTSEDVRALICAAGAGVALAPDRRGEGTNGLVCPLVPRIELSFEQDSFARHAASARARGLALTVVDRPGLAFDLDTPDDWRVWRAGLAMRRLPVGSA